MEKSLPKGWVNMKIGDLCKVERGGSPRPINKFLTDEKDGINWIKISDGSNSNKYIFKTKERIKKEGKLKSRFVQSGDLLLSNSMSFGRPYILKTDGCIHDGWLVLKKRLDNSYDSEFLYYLLSSSFLYNQFNDLASGSTVRNLNKDLVSKCTLIIPPLPEQKRIVAKLDKLFAQHEKIKSALDRIPKLLKVFRQQVLTQAATGKLTEKWREGKKLKDWNPILKKYNAKNLLDDKSQGYILPEIPKEWRWVTIMQLADVKGGKRLPKGEKLVNYDTGFPYIKAGDIKNGNVNSGNIEYLLETTQQKIKNYIVNSGDILITNVGACIGDIGIVPTNLNGANQTENTLKLCNLVEVEGKYLSFWLRSLIAQNYISQTVLSAGLGKLALGRMQVFPVPLTNFEEQQEIVHRVESLFAKADLIESSYQILKAKVDALPQALLHKAFKGELVPQISTDGDVNDLLAEIVRLKGEVKPKIARKKHRVE